MRRTTPRGRVLGPEERISPAAALGALLASLDDPGGAPRRARVGAVADLVLPHTGRADVLSDPTAEAVRATLLGVAAAAAG
ncbi:hypothetical protein [Streptomyces sp. NPDC048106]|uniref:hypothetical protein n=1 Tax=Streptomyces sp. NPDC048106 TaxID=3155750 RepID=UPI003454628C